MAIVWTAVTLAQFTPAILTFIIFLNSGPNMSILIQHIVIIYNSVSHNTNNDQMLSQKEKLCKNCPHEEFDNVVNSFHMRGYKPLMNLRTTKKTLPQIPMGLLTW